MNSPLFRFLRRVRIHGGEGGAVARALHHKAKRNSSPAVFGNVSNTTDERKLMSNKTSFKRIALALVVALGFGVMNTSSSYAAANAVVDETLTLSASSASIGYGETATLTITNTWIAAVSASAAAGETQVIHMAADAGGTASVSTIMAVHTSDSANVAGVLSGTPLTLRSTKIMSYNLASTSGNPYTNSGFFGTNTTIVESAISLTAGAFSKQTINVFFYNANPTTTGSTTYTITSRAWDGSVQKSARFTLTTTAPSRTAVASTSKLWLNQATNATPTTANTLAQRVIEADSTLVVSAGTAASPAIVGVIHPILNNASDTKTTLAGAVGRTESILVTVNGPGTVSLGDSTTRSKSQLVGLGETLLVYSDGTAGTMTLTGSIAGTNLVQAAKTITFTGKPASITATVDSAVVALGSTAVRAVSFTVKDSAGNNVTTSTPKNDFTPGGFFLTVADTKVVGGTQVGTTTAASTPCSYVAALSKWTCDLTLTDSGVATVYISDSTTQASAVVNSSALTITVAGTGYTGTAAFDKATYTIGEKAILTLTSKDSGGRNVANGDSHPWGATVRWTSNSATFAKTTGSDAAGGTFDNILNYLNSGADVVTFVNGVDTAVVFMPTVAGTYTLVGKPMGGLSTAAEATILTFTVVNPTDALVNAATAAAEAATDAANEAIDAANAATDAANIAAEAADAATVAAEEARDAADAATAAVEELATQVATLMAALSAQVKTLANTVAKIAKKVKA